MSRNVLDSGGSVGAASTARSVRCSAMIHRLSARSVWSDMLTPGVRPGVGRVWAWCNCGRRLDDSRSTTARESWRCFLAALLLLPSRQCIPQWRGLCYAGTMTVMSVQYEGLCRFECIANCISFSRPRLHSADRYTYKRTRAWTTIWHANPPSCLY